MKKLLLFNVLISSMMFLNDKEAFAAEIGESKKASVILTQDESPGANLLSITQASNLNFGSKSITLDDLIFKTTEASTIQITDLRGSAPGWRLSVSLGEFTSTDNKKLSGVQMFYPSANFSTVEGAVNSDIRKPVSVTNSSDISFTDPNVKGVLLSASSTPSSQVLINAANEKGNGQWTATYALDNSIELKVPSGNFAGAYSANLTYTLTDGPSAT